MRRHFVPRCVGLESRLALSTVAVPAGTTQPSIQITPMDDHGVVEIKVQPPTGSGGGTLGQIKVQPPTGSGGGTLGQA